MVLRDLEIGAGEPHPPRAVRFPGRNSTRLARSCCIVASRSSHLTYNSCPGSTLEGMHSQFRRPQREGQPSMNGIDMGLLEYVCKEVTVRLRIGAEDDGMTTNDHG